MYRLFVSFFLGLFICPLNAEAHKIQIMITVPRTVSTAFERAMMARGDHKVFHEPWNSEYIYRNKLGIAPSSEIIEAGGYEGIKKLLYSYADQKPVYVKDMIWGISEEIIGDDALLSDPNVILTILLRDPLLSIESFFSKISVHGSLEDAVNVTRWVFQYDSLVRLAEKYRNLRGEWPIFVEAEELCANPAIVMEAFCKRAGIEYMPETLSWEKKLPEEWEHLKRWHQEAADSEGFFIPKRQAKVPFSAVPEQFVPQLESIYEAQKPFYDRLLQMKSE